MTFAWPGMLWLLVLVPVLAALQVQILRRRRRDAQRYERVFQSSGRQRPGRGIAGLLPASLFLLGVTISIVALARPSATVMLPSQRGTVILSLDVSGSMKAQDIKPTRMEAVKEAARTFVNVQPRGVRFGIVAFSSTAILVQPPTSDKARVLAAIDRLGPQMYTAIGSGLLTALDAIFPKPASDAPEGPNAPLESAPVPEPPAVAPGSYRSAVIILLSDGQSNQGPAPLDAAEEAANRGVRVFTVGVGTREGTDLSFGGFTFHAILDEATLKRIAAITGGGYFKASSAEELRGIYQSLGTRVHLEQETTEITALAAGAAAALFLLMGALSLAWFNRLL
jgi:Ca-activated chloride channel family protein